MFPIIENIKDVLPAIEGKEEFIVVAKENYTIINYVVSKQDTFENPKEFGISEEEKLFRLLRRECRGIIFDSSGKIISRPLHKFFNVFEKEESQPQHIDLSLPHIILDKMDGSFIRPFIVRDRLLWGTKMGETDVAVNAEEFVSKNRNYIEFAYWAISENYTPIFEWVSRKNRIVIDYPVDNLVLLAVRHNNTGKYMPYGGMSVYGSEFNVPVVKNYGSFLEETGDITRFIEEVRSQTGKEGYVLRFADGAMYKIKCDEYCALHRSKDIASSERNIIQVILDNQIDDLKSLLLEEDLVRVNEIETKFWEAVKRNVDKYTKIYNHAYEISSGDRKKFALDYAKNYSKDEVSIIFALWSGSSPIGVVLNLVRKHSTREMKYEEFKSSFYDE